MSKMKENIEKAQIEIEAKEGVVKNGKMRKDFHFMPQAGWLNDSNGFIYYKGLTVVAVMICMASFILMVIIIL